MDERSEVIERIEALTKETGFIYTLVLILMRDLFLDPEKLADINWRDHLNVQELTFLTGLLVKHELSFDIPTEEESAKRFEEVYRLFFELHKKHVVRLFKTLTDGIEHKEPGNNTEAEYRGIFGDGYTMTEPIFYGGSGAYDFQYLDFAVEKYLRDKGWVSRNVGIEIRLMAQIARELKKIQERKFMTLPKMERSNFVELCKAALGIFCFTDKDIAQFGETGAAIFIDTFSIVPQRANAKLTLPGQYNEIQSRPIVRLPNSTYFLPIGFNLAESIYESPFYWMNGDTAYAPTAMRHRGKSAEEITSRLLAGVFGKENVHTQVEVKKEKGETITDIDVLAIAGNKAVIAQVKSKRLTELAKTGDRAKLVADFEIAVQDAYGQALDSRKAVVEKSNRLFTGGHELQLSEKIDDAYILCVTLDYYPAITQQVDVYLEKTPADPIPIAISIFDLDILTYYLKDPFEFLYYLRQRVALNDHFKADSEITLLGFHLKQKLYRRDAKTDMEMLDSSFAQLVDANFSAMRGSVPKTAATDKLYPQWENKEFQELIDQVRSTQEPGFTDALFFLYDFAGERADELIEVIKRTKGQTARDGQSHNAALLGTKDNSGITILAEPKTLGGKLISLAMMRKYKSKADSWLALGSIAGSPRLVDAIAFNKDPWKEDSAMEELVGKHFSEGKIRSRSGGRIGRNEPCPCGSGKKFKRCHGR